MKKKTVSFPKLNHFHPSQLAYILCILLITAINIPSLSKTINRQLKQIEKGSFFPGKMFEGVKSITEKTPYISYVTDKDINESPTNLLIAQAQLVLAPSILDFENTSHPFLIFDFTNKTKALQKLQELNVKPIRSTGNGFILATPK